MYVILQTFCAGIIKTIHDKTHMYVILQTFCAGIIKTIHDKTCMYVILQTFCAVIIKIIHDKTRMYVILQIFCTGQCLRNDAFMCCYTFIAPTYLSIYCGNWCFYDIFGLQTAVLF